MWSDSSLSSPNRDIFHVQIRFRTRVRACSIEETWGPSSKREGEKTSIHKYFLAEKATCFLFDFSVCSLEEE